MTHVEQSTPTSSTYAPRTSFHCSGWRRHLETFSFLTPYRDRQVHSPARLTLERFGLGFLTPPM